MEINICAITPKVYYLLFILKGHGHRFLAPLGTSVLPSFSSVLLQLIPLISRNVLQPLQRHPAVLLWASCEPLMSGRGAPKGDTLVCPWSKDTALLSSSDVCSYVNSAGKSLLSNFPVSLQFALMQREPFYKLQHIKSG